MQTAINSFNSICQTNNFQELNSYFSVFKKGLCNLNFPEDYIFGISVGTAASVAKQMCQEIIHEQCQRTWTPINYAQCLLVIATNAYFGYSIIQEGINRKSIDDTYLNIEKKLHNKQVFLVVDADHDWRKTSSSFSSKRLSVYDKINSVFSVAVKKINGIDHLEKVQDDLLSRGNVIKYLVLMSHGNESGFDLGKNEFVGKENCFTPSEKLSWIDRARILLFDRVDKTISQKFELFLDKDKFDADREPRIKKLEKNRLLNDKKLKKIFCNLAKDAKIILNSCSTGKGSSNIAQHISNLAEGREVIAPTTLITNLSLDIKINNEKSTEPKLNARFKSTNFALAGLVGYVFFQILVPNVLQNSSTIFPLFTVFSAYHLAFNIGLDVTKVTTGQIEEKRDSTMGEKFLNYVKQPFFPLPSF